MFIFKRKTTNGVIWWVVSRADPTFDEETGVASLRIVAPKDYDSAVYKCVARTKQGRVTSEARLMLGGRQAYLFHFNF